MLRALAVVACVAFGAAATAHDDNGLTRPPLTNAALEADLTVEGCVDCTICSLGGASADDHKAYPGDETSWSRPGEHPHDETHTDCQEGYCTTFHPTCLPEDMPTPEELSSLRGALMDGQSETVLRMLQEKAWLAYNGPRGAVQIVNCGGNVVVHIPVTRAFAEYVEEQL